MLPAATSCSLYTLTCNPIDVHEGWGQWPDNCMQGRRGTPAGRLGAMIIKTETEVSEPG